MKKNKMTLMKISLSWLKSFLSFDIDEKTLENTLTLAGLEVDKITKTPLRFSNVVAAQIEAVEKHPFADKLRLLKVTDGYEAYQIVCGDMSCKVGMKVALAKVGATLTSEDGKVIKIKKSKIRDVESFGMLCSEQELGLKEHSHNIMHLDESILMGSQLSDYIGDLILEVSLTPNLGHCMSMLGVARELSAHLELPLKIPSRPKHSHSHDICPVVNNNCEKVCPVFLIRYINNISVQPSPKWLKEMIENLGFRSVNTLVDATNYIMIELGQPLHIYDADKLRGPNISVKKSEKDFSLETIDGQQYDVPVESIVVYSDDQPIGIAGIMGGKNSEVDENTKNIICEAALFDAKSIRKTSKKLGLRTEASNRFEKGVDIQGVEYALEQVTSLISELSPSAEVGPISGLLPQTTFQKKIRLRLEKTNKLLGTTLTSKEIKNFLTRLGMTVNEKDSVFDVLIPSYRNDIAEEIDLIEEVARIYGYNSIKKNYINPKISVLNHSEIYLFKENIRKKLSGMGLQEFLTCDLISPKHMDSCLSNYTQSSEAILVIKPSSIDQSILRMSLLPGLLEAFKFNQDRQHENIVAYEIGNIYYRNQNEFIEKPTLSIGMMGKRNIIDPQIVRQTTDFFDIKGVVQMLLSTLGVKEAYYNPSCLSSFHPKRQAEIKIDSLLLGYIGEVHPAVLRNIGLSKRVNFAQLDISQLFQERSLQKNMTPIPMYPSSSRDWTVSIPPTMRYQLIYEAVNSFKSRILSKWELLGIYKTDQCEKVNYTFRFIYQNAKKTLEQHQVDKEQLRLTEHVAKNLSDLIN